MHAGGKRHEVSLHLEARVWGHSRRGVSAGSPKDELCLFSNLCLIYFLIYVYCIYPN